MKKRLWASVCLLLAVSVLLCACGTQVYTVDVTGLAHLASNGDVSIQEGQAYSGKLTPDKYYALPEAITVTIGGIPLESGYTYDRETGAFSIDAASITGNIAISAVAHERIVGTWEGDVDMSTYVTKIMAAGDPSLAKYFQYSGLIFRLVYTFAEDGSYCVAVKEDSVAAWNDAFRQSTQNGLRTMLEDLLRTQGITIDWEEYLAAGGLTLDDLFDEAMGDVDTEGIADDLAESGSYEIAGNVICFDGGRNDAMAFHLSDGVLTLTFPGGLQIPDIYSGMLPLVLTRVK